MIISHKYKFIFIKTKKTAGTSIETYLSPLCGDSDIFTPFGIEEKNHKPRNYTGYFNPIREICLLLPKSIITTLNELKNRRRYFNHIPAYLVRCRVPKRIWRTYFKFCVERNPWDKALSHYHFLIRRHEALREMTFDEYLQKGYHCINFRKYTEYGASEKVIVDRILKYENLSEELSEVFGKLGIPFDGVLGVNAKGNFRTDRRPYQEVLAPDQAEKIEQLYRKEIFLLNYTC